MVRRIIRSLLFDCRFHYLLIYCGTAGFGVKPNIVQFMSNVRFVYINGTQQKKTNQYSNSNAKKPLDDNVIELTTLLFINRSVRAHEDPRNDIVVINIPCPSHFAVCYYRS